MPHQHAADDATKSPSWYSWPPSPTLLRFHLLIRAILALNNTIGFSLLFPSGIIGGQVSPFIAASFEVVSVFFIPFFMLWNRKHLKRAEKTNSQLRLVNEGDNPASRRKLTGLKFVTFMDGLGTLAFICAYIPLMIELCNAESWGWYANYHLIVLYAYGSVTNLIAILLHAFLFTTEVAQLFSATRVHRPKSMICPHCNHTMTRLSTSDPVMTPPESEHSAHEDMLGESLVDANEARISMSPGQETGTTYKTPRQSEHQSRAAASVAASDEANETGEGERDTLITKSG